MKSAVCLLWFLGVFAGSILTGLGADKGPPLPVGSDVLQRVIERAKKPGNEDATTIFLSSKQTTTEELDGEGQVVERNVRLSQGRSGNTGTGDAGKWTRKNGFSLDEDLLKRYDFTVTGRETLNGRSTLVLNFSPKKPSPPFRHFQDRVLNRIIGTVWVDESEYDVVKASICLGESVSFGPLGAIHEFAFAFERARMGTGTWITQWTETFVRARKLFTAIHTRKREEWKDFKTITAMGE